MQKCKSNHSIFYRNSQAGIILLVVHVNDIVITRNDMTGISSLKSFLHGQFYTKDLGMLNSVFYRNSQAGIILLFVYVDDIVITRNDMAGISSLKSFLHGQFYTNDLGML